MKPPAASPGRAEKQLPAPGLARLLLSKSRGRSSHGSSATARSSPMFVSRSRSVGRAAAAAAAAAAADGEPSSPKVTCIGQVRMRKNKKSKNGKKQPPAREKRGYCRCLKKAFLCGGLFDRKQPKASPVSAEEVERSNRSATRWSRWRSNASTSYSKKDLEVAVKPPDPRRNEEQEEDGDEEVVFGLEKEEAEDVEDDVEEEEKVVFVSSATTTPPKNALLLMRCRSAPQNRAAPLTSRFPVAAPSPAMKAKEEVAASPEMEKVVEKEADQAEEGEKRQEQEEEEEVEEEEEEEEEMRCSSARPLVLPRCKSEPATIAAAKMAAATTAEASAGCFWANGGSTGRRRHVPAAVSEALASH